MRIRNFLNQFICFYFILFNSGFLTCVYSITCDLPERCRLEMLSTSIFIFTYEKEYKKMNKIMCDVNDNAFGFGFNESKWMTSSVVNTSQICDSFDQGSSSLSITFTWKSIKELAILDERFNFSNAIKYFSYFNVTSVRVNFYDLKGLDVNILDHKDLNKTSTFYSIGVSNSRFDFYHNKRKLQSCQDFTDLNLTQIVSIFQIPNDHKFVYLVNLDYKQNSCPLLFRNSRIIMFFLDMADTFYKKNILTFSNETLTDLNSNIENLQLTKVVNINLDLNFIHQSVFKNTKFIQITDSSSLNSISGEIFKHLSNLKHLLLVAGVFKKINHKQGIGWIRQINFGLNVNLSKMNETKKTPIEIKIYSIHPNNRIIIFPDEDFCLYLDFPFNQLVIVYESMRDEFLKYTDLFNDFSCTHLWIGKYYENYLEYKYLIYNLNRNENDIKSIRKVLDSTAYKSISKCNFEERIRLCNKSNYHVKDYWDENDFSFLNKKIQTAFKISLYPVSFLGLITNLIVVIVILHKDNNDLFKEFKQYSFLWLNSLFCIMILLIELLSWMTECFYPFEIFCPETRKLVAFQYFKIIFHECLVTAFRFMCNFTYIGFALNRIGLIGREHGKLVTFMSQLGIKRYIVVTFFISLTLSWVKYFKYKINYFYPNLNFPMSNELDIKNGITHEFDDFYFTFNSISDLVNYLVFVVICIIIDICMVVKLRRVLDEKTKKSESMNEKQQNQNKKAENEAAVNNAIKMVVLNSAIGIFFKLPVLIIPLLNLYSQFYYKDLTYTYYHPSFAVFYSMLLDGGFFTLIQDISSFFYTLSLSIQMFIYKHFDKKFRTGFQRLKKKSILKIKNCFHKS